MYPWPTGHAPAKHNLASKDEVDLRQSILQHVREKRSNFVIVCLIFYFLQAKRQICNDSEASEGLEVVKAIVENLGKYKAENVAFKHAEAVSLCILCTYLRR